MAHASVAPMQAHDLHSTTTTTQTDTGLLAKLQQRIQILHLQPPVWDITVEPGTEHVAQRFVGTLIIVVPSGQDIIVSVPEPEMDTRGAGLASKKDVKAVLAQKAWVKLEALPLLAKEKAKDLQKQVLTSPADNGDGINWIGRILEYNNSLPMEHRHLVYTESTITPSSGAGPLMFSAVLSLGVRLGSLDYDKQNGAQFTTLTFPSANSAQLFPSKKQAKLHCSRLAGQALIKQGLLQEDGSLPPKQRFAASITAASSVEASVSKDIAGLCDELGLPPPRYVFESPSGDPNNPFVDCSVHFPPTTGLPVPFITVRNVYGKKRAKDDCANLLMEQFPKIRDWRLQGGIWTE